jgi:D-alanyl-lipoteichoic acid acyltransferase DltB (MBOAT superfamily)
LTGSLFFYGYKSPELLLLLLLTIAITYLGGLVLSAHPKKSLLSLFLILNFSVLVIFKYSDFILTTIRRFGIFGGGEGSGLDSLGLILPVGLSFYIFQSTTYLIDVYRGKLQPERNALLYAAFVSFFSRQA